MAQVDMLTMIFRAMSPWVVLAWLLPTAVLGHKALPATAALVGLWKGPLAIPGGSLPIQISIAEPTAGRLTAMLDLPAKRLSRIPTAVAFRGDTVVFYAAKTDARFVCLPSADGQVLRGTWLQPGLRVPLTLSRFVESAGPLSASRKAAAVATTFHTEEVSVMSGNVRLAGTLNLPDGAGPFPAVVLLSDMGSQDRDARQGNYRMFAGLAASLARQGIAVLRLDDRGVGQSGGDGSQTTTAELVHDAQACLGYLRVRPSIDPARTGLIGHGEGGNVALLAAAQPVPPAFVVTLAASGVSGLDLLAHQPEPIANPADTAQAGSARRQAWADVLSKAAKLRASGSNAAQVETYIAQQRQKAKSEERKQAEATLKFRRAMLEIVQQTASDDQAQAIVVNMLRQRYPNLDPALARSRATELTSPWDRYYLSFDPQPSLAEIKCPALLLHGTDDHEASPTNLAALEKGLKGNKQVTARLLPGVNHWFQTPAAELLPNADGSVDTLISPLLLDTLRSWVLQEARL